MRFCIYALIFESLFFIIIHASQADYHFRKTKSYISFIILFTSHNVGAAVIFMNDSSLLNNAASTLALLVGMIDIQWQKPRFRHTLWRRAAPPIRVTLNERQDGLTWGIFSQKGQ